MAQNRDIEIGGVWANGAPDPPAEPIAENTYRNSTLTPQQVEEGWPFQKIVNSADFNEVMHRVTGLLRILEHWGMMPWSPLTTYAVGAHVLGSNNVIYKAIQATTGNDPISSPTQWENTGKGLSDHIAVQTNVHGSTNTPTANRLPQYDSSGRLKSNAPSASNDVARKAETDVVQTNLDTHTGATNPHSATATPTANRLAMWDASGRLKSNAPSASNDVARKAETDALQVSLDTHAGLTNPHSATSAATANRIILRDANGRAKVADGVASNDIATFGQVSGKAGKGPGSTLTNGYFVVNTAVADFIVQFGKSPAVHNDSNYTLSFAVPFPNAALVPVPGIMNDNTGDDDVFPRVISMTNNSITLRAETAPNGRRGGTRFLTYIVIGY